MANQSKITYTVVFDHAADTLTVKESGCKTPAYMSYAITPHSAAEAFREIAYLALEKAAMYDPESTGLSFADIEAQYKKAVEENTFFARMLKAI